YVSSRHVPSNRKVRPQDTRRLQRRLHTPAVGRSLGLENCTYREWPSGTAGPGFLFQSLKQSAAVAVTAEARMDPEIMNLHALTSDRAHDAARQAAVDVAEPDGHVSTRIDGGGGNVVGDEFVA